MNKKTAFPWRKALAVSEVYARFDPSGVKIAQVVVQKDCASWNVYPTEFLDGDIINGKRETLLDACDFVDELLESRGWVLLHTDVDREQSIRL